MKKLSENFISGALILSLGGLLAKVLGALYRIPLTNVLGSYGMGLYQLVFPPYILFLTIAQAGVPTALSKLIAENNQLGLQAEGKKLFRVSFAMLTISGLACALAMAALSGVIANAQGNADTAKAFLMVSPALLFVPITNVLKAYFQGNMNMLPSGATTVMEQIVKLAVGLFCATKFMPDVQKAVLGAVFAITVSEFCSLAIMATVYLVHRKKHAQLPLHFRRQQIPKQCNKVLLVALPVALGGFAMQMSQVVDSVMVVNLINSTSATELYGLWTGPVNSMLGLPIALSSGVAVSALPSITKKYFSNDKQSLNDSFNSAIKLTFVIAVPCALGMTCLSKPILQLLYARLPEEEIHVASVLLSLSALSIVFLAITQTAVSVCQAVGKPYATVVIISLSIVIKAVVNAILLPQNKINIYGSAISESLCYLFATVCVIIYLRKQIGLKLDWTSCLVKPLSASMTMTLFITLCVCFADKVVNTPMGTLLTIGFAGIVYFATLFALKAFDAKEIKCLSAR